MYICEHCKNLIKEKTSSNKLVIASRNKTYPLRSKANKFNIDGKIKFIADPGGTGIEIVSEVIVCSFCFEKLSE